MIVVRIYQVIIASPGLAGCLFVKIQLVQPTLFRLLRCFCSKGRNIQSIARQCVPSYPLFWTEKTEHSGLSKSRCSVLFRYFYSKRRNTPAFPAHDVPSFSKICDKKRTVSQQSVATVRSFFNLHECPHGTFI